MAVAPRPRARCLSRGSTRPQWPRRSAHRPQLHNSDVDHREQEVRASKKSKKPVRDNRHRYLSFTERLAEVKVDVLKRTGLDAARTGSLLDEGFDEDYSSHFEQQMAKWGELNLTAHFTAFLRDVGQRAASLALLLHNKEEIVDALCRHLAVPESKAVRPLCACLAALARDLRTEAYPFFRPKLVPALLQLLESRDTEQLEEAFSCLAYLFKFLVKFVVDDFAETFALLLPALRHRQWFIRKFSAEVLSYLVRQLHPESLPAHVETILAAAALPGPAPGVRPAAHAAQQSELTEGLGLLLFESTRGVRPRSHPPKFPEAHPPRRHAPQPFSAPSASVHGACSLTSQRLDIPCGQKC